MHIRDWLLLEYGELGEGVTSAGNLCPQCKGGDSGEGTLSVSQRDGEILWYCHRASCGLRGRSSTGGGSTVRRTAPVDVRGAVGRGYIREATALPEHIVELLRERYSIVPRHFAKWQLGWAAEEARVVQPVFNYQGEPVGSILRSLTGATPKTISHTESGAMAWYTKAASDRLIIVEDQLSAIRAADHMSAVALLGTNLTEERLYEMREAGFKTALLALDKDAFTLAVRYVTKLRGIIGLQLLPIQKDIKNQSEEELNELFSAKK